MEPRAHRKRVNAGWARDNNPRLPVPSRNSLKLHKRQFKSNILCRKHNNELSPVDEAGTNAFETLADLASGKRLRRRKIDGHLFERRLLETLINMEM
jgi:hypothetical protein